METQLSWQAGPVDDEGYRKLRERFVERLWAEIGPLEEQIEVHEQLPYDVVLPVLQEIGAFALLTPAEHGGLGLSVSQYLPLIATCAQVHGGIREIVHAHNFATHAFSSMATEEQSTLLAGTPDASVALAFALTEPGVGTGSDIATRATPTEAGWTLTGTKWMITNSDIATHFIVFARTGDPEAREVSAFLVDRKSHGVAIEPLPELMGCKGGEHGRVALDDVVVGRDALLGELGTGLEHMTASLEISRLFVSASSLGVAERSLELSRRYAAERVTFGKPIGERPGVQRYLAEMAADVYAMASMIADAAAKADAGERIPVEASICKMFGAEAVARVTDRALLVHGGMGYTRAHSIERLFRDARLNFLEEGTPTVQEMVIARGLRSLPMSRLSPLAAA